MSVANIIGLRHNNFSFMNNIDTQDQLTSAETNQRKTPTTRTNFFNSQTKLIILLLILILAPDFMRINNPTPPQNIYQYVPNWYMTWAILNKALPALFLFTFLFIRKKWILFSGLIILICISVFDIFLEIMVLKPFLPGVIYFSRVIVIIIDVWILSKYWRKLF